MTTRSNAMLRVVTGQGLIPRPRLLEMIEDLNTRLDRYIRGHLIIEGRTTITHDEHKAILDACRDRDADLCARLTRIHILEAASGFAGFRTDAASGAYAAGPSSHARSKIPFTIGAGSEGARRPKRIHRSGSLANGQGPVRQDGEPERLRHPQ